MRFPQKGKVKQRAERLRIPQDVGPLGGSRQRSVRSSLGADRQALKRILRLLGFGMPCHPFCSLAMRIFLIAQAAGPDVAPGWRKTGSILARTNLSSVTGSLLYLAFEGQQKSQSKIYSQVTARRPT